MADPTRGQLERTLSQRIQALYREQLGHQPGKVTCQLFAEEVAIIIENSMTRPEQLLVKSGETELVEQFRDTLHDAIRPNLVAAIEEVLDVPVVDIMGDATFETGRTGLIVVLEKMPSIRNPHSVPKRSSSGSQDSNDS